MSKPKLLAIDLGTYCDNYIMINAMRYFPKTYDIIYLTDINNKLSANNEYYKVEHFKTPDFFTNDPKLKIADPSRHIALWVMKHPKNAFTAYEWTVSMHSRIQALLEMHNDIKRIVILYPALLVLWQMKDDILRNIPTYVLYYAPGYVNTKTPWMFDSMLTKTSFKLYENPAKENVDSGIKNLSRAMLSKALIGNEQNIFAKLKLVHHVVCWDRCITIPINPYFRASQMQYIGSIKPGKDTSPLPDLPKTHNGYIFMSFGSYNFAPSLKKRVQKLLPILELHCRDTGSHVVYHNGDYDSEYITSIPGYIPYTKIIPKSRLVIFTGSACLLNLCYYYKVPMHFLPVLTEQYFWAKNYHHFTGTNFTELEFVPTRQTKQYLAKVSQNMHSYDAAKTLYKILKSS